MIRPFTQWSNVLPDFMQLVENLEAELDNVVNIGTDDELFIASYLQGHLAVIAKPMEVQIDATLEKLDSAMQTSLHAAFSNNELEVADQEKVLQLWAKLRAK